ncbi:hypothetical protein [Hymenobacter rubripertinctus]|uniref:Uncharacterized protein n=1 Tax=Hymenobacter rubripertinctus TaxID=2029981 RepID=A0A418QNM2_9BACT|nr:hypothetical protein [Hymenobacter rubripertinctus]RIY06691.1 hypothetical protein D0T11_18240 [Hymenobacter rubripertinctus]
MKMLPAQLAAGLLTLAACHAAPETPATTPEAALAAPASGATVTVAPAVAASTARTAAAGATVTDSLAAVRPFVPAGYQMLDVATGDLNRDAYPDKLLALDTILVDSLRRESEARRPLLLLTGQPDGTFRLAARNDNAVMCSSCGGMMGDPYRQLVIKNGYFLVEHYGGAGWRWTRIFTFKYDPTARRWFLHRAGGESFHSSDPEKAKTYVETARDFGRVPLESFKGDVG